MDGLRLYTSVPSAIRFSAPTPWTALITVLLGIPLASLLIVVYTFALYPVFISTLRDIPGPKNRNPLWGHWGEFTQEEVTACLLRYVAVYGPVTKFNAFLGEERLLFTDPKALAHVLISHVDNYPKADDSRRMLRMLTGDGLLVAEGKHHRHQKRILQPAFSDKSVKLLVPIFFACGRSLARKLERILQDPVKERESLSPRIPDGTKVVSAHASIERGARDEREKGRAQEVPIDLLVLVSRTTLDALGKAGFGYDFDALRSGSSSPLAVAFAKTLSAATSVSYKKLIWEVLCSYFPCLRVLPDPNEMEVARSRKVMEGVGKEILERRKDEIRHQLDLEMRLAAALDPLSTNQKVVGSAWSSDLAGEVVEGGTGHEDILTYLVRANMAEGSREKVKLSEAEVIGQITTMIFAGSETTSASITWLMYHLACYPTIQSRLRAEIIEARKRFELEDPSDVDTDADAAERTNRAELTYEQLEGLPYLDAVVKENLRFLAPVSNTARTAIRDDVIPLSTPITSADGKRKLSSVTVKAGQCVIIPIATINRHPSVWGPDAGKFNPDRWLSALPATVSAQASIARFTFGPAASFLAGPRGCIGHRFAVAETKAIVSTLVREFEFCVQPDRKVGRGQWLVTRPWDVNRGEEGAPLLVRRWQGQGHG